MLNERVGAKRERPRIRPTFGSRLGLGTGASGMVQGRSGVDFVGVFGVARKCVDVVSMFPSSKPSARINHSHQLFRTKLTKYVGVFV